MIRTLRPEFVLLATCTAALAGALTVGCSPDYYRADADQQIDRLVKQRKPQTLSYEPESDARDRPTPDAPGTMLCQIPVTPIAVSQGKYLEPAVANVPFGPLGPVNQMPASGVLPPQSDYRSSAREGSSVEPPIMGPPSPNRALRRMDLYGVLKFCVQNNRDYKSNMESLYLSALDVTLQRHLFAPRPFVNTSVGYAGTPALNTTTTTTGTTTTTVTSTTSNYQYQSALTAATTAGVQQQLPYGGQIVASSLVQFVDALNSNATSGESANVALNASVPLLRGAGFINLEGLVSSERNMVYTVRNFETYRRAFLVDAATQYFNLLSSRNAVLNRQKQLEGYIDLVERSKALFAAGKGNYLDVQRSLNSQISAETDVIQASEQYRSSLDAFKVFLGMDPREDLELIPVELDVNLPSAAPDESIRLAQTYRLDVQTARDQIDDARRAVENAKNGLLPDLTFSAGGQIGNNAYRPAGDLSSNNGSYNAGLTLGLPVDRVAERNTYRKSLIYLQQAQRSFEVTRDNAAVAALAALRRIRSAKDQVELNKANVKIAQARLDLANSLLRQPLLNPLAGLDQSNRDVVEAQQSLISAQDALDQARASLQIQVLSYYRDTGTLRIDPDAGALGRAMMRDGSGR
jgi:outer membrane protein TolC